MQHNESDNWGIISAFLSIFRDGLQESNVVTKTFLVDDANADDELDSLFSEDSYVPKLSTRRSLNLSKKKVNCWWVVDNVTDIWLSWLALKVKLVNI